MRARFFTYILPIGLSVLTAAAIIFFKNSGSAILPQIPYDLHLIGAVIYSVVLAFSLQADLKERSFWVIVSWSVSLNLLGAVLRTYVWPFLNVPSVIPTLTLILYIVAMFLIVIGLFRLMTILGVKLEKKEKLYLNLSYLGIFIIFAVTLFPAITRSSYNIESILTYALLVIFCALSIPLAVLLFRFTKDGALRLPFLFVSLSVIFLAVQVTGMIFALSRNVLVPNLELYIFIPYILFVMFAMMAMASRLVIARKQDIYLDS